MKSDEIRNQFLEFFKDRQHTIVPSAPVVPYDDSTLLFTNAGMNQFKDVFLGLGSREFKRAVSTQKCIRVTGKHNDLEEVGQDGTHHTFFEMLGNWSFGDYYKKEAVVYAWDLVTRVWELPKEKLWATVYKDDDEAFELWKKYTDVNKSHIVKLGDKDNFWEMGDTGPCGPCSEIILDKGEEYSSVENSNIENDPNRFVELWNLVFIQYNKDEEGHVSELPQKHIDTGLGFERITAVLQGVDSNYKTDIFKPIIDKLFEIAQISGFSEKNLVPVRVISDHIRSISFALADGVIPSNEGRGYVIRRILRRASRFGRKIGLYEPFLFRLVNPLAVKMQNVFPEVIEKKEYITKIVRSEEEIFGKTLDRGIEIFEDIVGKSKNNIISGEDAFKLYDTFGFPIDLTRLMAKEKGFDVDLGGFEKEMQKQKERSKDASTRKSDHKKILIDTDIKSKFYYEKFEMITQIKDINSSSGNKVDELNKGESGYLILKETPFYAESGGQVGDTGKIYNENFEFEVEDTQKKADSITHIGKVKKGIVKKGVEVKAKIDIERRKSIMRNHTATHLLHRALKRVLGNYVQQSGSLVAPEYLRFDFNHFSKLTEEEIEEIEKIVNNKITENLKVNPVADISFEQAKKEGAVALFGEKYGEKVRMIKIDKYSKELCGGTHISNTGEIGLFKIISEGSIASGIRRITAITGKEAFEYVKNQEKLITKIQNLLNTEQKNILKVLQKLIEDNKKLQKVIGKYEKKQSIKISKEYIKNAEKIGDITVPIADIGEIEDMESFKKLADEFREGIKNTISLIVGTIDDKVNMICTVTDDLIKQGKFKAGELVKIPAMEVGGGGGGKPHFATAGGKNKENIPDAIEKFKENIRKKISDND